MGSRNSKQDVRKIPLKVSNRKCTCELYHNYKHCCFNQCFPKIVNVQKLVSIPGCRETWTFDKDHEIQFKLEVSKLDLVDISDDIFITIFSFLTHAILNGYYIHCHGEINKYIENNVPCKIWFGKPKNKSDPEYKLMLLGKTGTGKNKSIFISLFYGICSLCIYI